MARWRVCPSAIVYPLILASIILTTSTTLGGGFCESPADCGRDFCEIWRCVRVYPGQPGLCQGPPSARNCNDGNPQTVDSCNGGSCRHVWFTQTPAPVPTPTPMPPAVGGEVAKIAISCGPSDLPNTYLRFCENNCRSNDVRNQGFCSFIDGNRACDPSAPDAIQTCCPSDRQCGSTSCQRVAEKLGFGGECFTSRVNIGRIVLFDGFTFDIWYCGVHRTDACPIPTATPRPCRGDCDGSGNVTVDELVLAVNIALGQWHVSTCVNADTNGDGGVKVNELVAAVGVALNGCQ